MQNVAQNDNGFLLVKHFKQQSRTVRKKMIL